MTLIVALSASTSFLFYLVNPAARALAVGALVALALVAFRRTTTAFRLFTWTAVLYSALAMPLLQWMLPPLPVPAPRFLQTDFAPVPEVASQYQQAGLPFREFVSHPTTAAPPQPVALPQATIPGRPLPSKSTQPDHSISFSMSWTSIAAALYLVVAFVLLLRFCVGLIFARKLTRASLAVDDPSLVAKLRAHAAGLARTPQAAESELISVPLTMGVRHSTILLPADWREWDDPKLDAVLAHEVSHVARRDALTQHLSLLHRAIFWFSPLAWWLHRHLAALAEQASDEAALACGADCKDYARTLLEFFAALQPPPTRVWWQGVAMAKPGQAEQRVERILSWKGSLMNTKTSSNKSIVAATLTLALPVLYLAASAHPVRARAASAQAPTSTSAPNTAPAHLAAPNPQSAPVSANAPAAAPATVTDDGVDSDGPASPPPPPAPGPGVTGGPPGPAPIAPMSPMAPMNPIAQVAPTAPVAPAAPSHRGFSYHYGYDDEQRFVIVSGKTDSFTMSGSSEDARHVEKLKKQISGDFIWFQRDEKSYVIRDQATVDRALKLWLPQQELGKKQEALGKQQEALGKQQEELGARMQQVRVNVPDLTAELEKLKAELKQLNSGATSNQVGHIQSEIGELQSKIGNVQSQAGEQQGKLGEEMGVLGEKQGKLGEEQGELGRQQGELAEKSSKDMKQLLDDAISKGTAQPEI